MLTDLTEILHQGKKMVTADLLSFGFFLFSVSKFSKRAGFLSFMLIWYLGYKLISGNLTENLSDPDRVTSLLKLSSSPTEREVMESLQRLRTDYHPSNSVTGDESMFVRINELRGFFIRVGPLAAANAFKMFGEVPDHHRILNNLELENEIERLKTSKGLDFVSNYLMLVLVTFVFFYNSAARGFFQKGLIILCFITAMISEVSLGQPPSTLRIFHLPVTEYTDVTIQTALGYSYLDIPQIVKLIRLLLVVTLCQFFLYGLVYQHTAQDRLLHASLWYGFSVSVAFENVDSTY